MELKGKPLGQQYHTVQQKVNVEKNTMGEEQARATSILEGKTKDSMVWIFLLRRYLCASIVLKQHIGQMTVCMINN